MSDAADLYEADFMRWAEQQAAALRDAGASGANLPLDWDNLAEEIENLARSQRRELRSRLDTIIEHLLKLAVSPSRDPRAGWTDTVLRERGEVEALLQDNPSLRREVDAIATALRPKVADRVGRGLINRGEAGAGLLSKIHDADFDADQILGDWFPISDDIAA